MTSIINHQQQRQQHHHHQRNSQSSSSITKLQSWVITVKERNPKQKPNKIRDQSYTLFVLTPSSHLALVRSLENLVNFDQLLRTSYPTVFQSLPPPPSILSPSTLNSRIGTSSNNNSFSLANKRATIATMPTNFLSPPGSNKKSKTTKQVLQSISKSLSPPKIKSSISNQRQSPAVNLPPTPPHSPGRNASLSNPNLFSSDEEDFVDVSLTESEKKNINRPELVKQNEEVQIGVYLTELSTHSILPKLASSSIATSSDLSDSAVNSLKDTEEWREFFKIGKEDVERERKLPNKLQSDHQSRAGKLQRSAGSTGSTTHHIRSSMTSISNAPKTPLSSSSTEHNLITKPESTQTSPKEIQDSSRAIDEPSSGTSNSEDQSSSSNSNHQSLVRSSDSRESVAHDARKEAEETLGLSSADAEALQFAIDFSPTISIPPFPAMIPSTSELPSPQEVNPPSTSVPLVSSASSISSATTTKPPLNQDDTSDPPASANLITAIDSESLSDPPNESAVTPPIPEEPTTALISKPKIDVKDFEIIRVLGKGCAGKVLMVRYRSPHGSSAKKQRVYAMKSIRKNHVLAHRELQHTLTEQGVLKRVANEPGSNPFIVRLWWSFHDKDHLFLVMDFHPGGDLATQLARWGRLGRDRARFYAAEITEGVTALHRSGVIYRDLKPENILIAFDGHIVLTDFGLSKQFVPATADVPSEDRTLTFCGTAEYLAPEVLLAEPYSYEVDWWSFGTMLYEMLTGLTPFWSEDHATMYRRVLHDELTFVEDSSRVMDHDTKTLLRGLLQRNPAVRMTGARIKKHPYFGMIDWDHVRHKRYIPPYVPAVNPNDATDTQNFDETFLAMEPTHVQDEDPASSPAADGEDKQADSQDQPTSDEEAPGKIEPEKAVDEDGNDVFDGYSFTAPRTDKDSIIEEETEGETDDTGLTSQSHDQLCESAKTPTSNASDEQYSSSSTRPTSNERETSENTGKSASELGLADGTTPATASKKKQDDVDEDWDVVDTPEDGLTDLNGGRRRGKRTNNTLFARGVVDKYKLRMKKFNEPATANITSPSQPSLIRHSSSSIHRSHQDPTDSDNGAASQSKPQSRRRFGMKRRTSDRQRTLSPTGGGLLESMSRPNFLSKGRSMSNTADHARASQTENSGRRRLNFNGFLSSYHLGSSSQKQVDTNSVSKSRTGSGLSRSASVNKRGETSTPTSRQPSSNNNSLGSASNNRWT